MLTLEQINAASPAEFTALLAGTYEHSPWVAEAAWARRPFATLAALKHALAATVREAGREAQLSLVRAHPDLAGKAMLSAALTAESRHEQATAGLSNCTPQERPQADVIRRPPPEGVSQLGSGPSLTQELAQIQQLNAEYNASFGWPFILAVRGPRGLGLTRQEIIATLQRRLAGDAQFEFAECLRHIHRIAELRLNDKFGFTPTRGQRVWDEAEELAAHSDPGFKEHGQLTVTYLTDAHLACARQLQGWMREAGFDEVHIDAVGNVVGVYHGADPASKRLLTGSHYDTVRNGGKYDGRLGILVPLAAVRELHAAGRRLPFGIELLGFAEEEGQRYKATFLGSGALTATSTRPGSTSLTPMAFQCAPRCNMPACPPR